MQFDDLTHKLIEKAAKAKISILNHASSKNSPFTHAIDNRRPIIDHIDAANLEAVKKFGDSVRESATVEP